MALHEELMGYKLSEKPAVFTPVRVAFEQRIRGEK
jgi:hypothetical protein